ERYARRLPAWAGWRRWPTLALDCPSRATAPCELSARPRASTAPRPRGAPAAGPRCARRAASPRRGRPRRGCGRTAATRSRGGARGRAGGPADELGAVGGRVVDELGDRLVLVGGHHRPGLGLPQGRVAHRQPLGLPDDALEEAVGDLADDVDPLDPRAGLAGVREAAPHRPGDGVGEVGIGADDLRVLAAELEHRALEIASAD